MSKFLERLAAGPLLCDGAMGTMLHNTGQAHHHFFDELNLVDPALVAGIHRTYIDAGADIIETNTFGANYYKLREHGMEGRVADINMAAVELAHRVVGGSFKDILIAGSVGPLGGRLAPLGRIRLEQAFEAFKTQIGALNFAGVDLIILETFSDLLELEQAIMAARAVNPDLAVVAQMTFANDGLTPLGDSPAQVARKLLAAQPDVLGVNCSIGPARVLRSLQSMAAHLPAETRLSAMPNAGWPERIGGRLLYPAGATYFADYTVSLVQSGASLVGGCCGTSPEHIAHMRQALNNLPAERSTLIDVRPMIEEPVRPADKLAPTRMAQMLTAGRFVASVELHPPRGASAAKVLAAAQMLQEAGATTVNVADSPVARMRMSPWAICHLIQDELGLETILNFPTRGRNLLRIQGDLLAAHALNIRNLFVVMGDPTTIGDYPEAFNHHDVVSSGLIHLVKQGFNTGVDYAGREISQPTNFLVGCALNLNAADPYKEMKLLKKKIDNGADFAMTQPIFEPTCLDNFKVGYEAEFGSLNLPIMGSILPLYNARHARFLHNEVPGISIPQWMQDRMAKAGDDASMEGLAIARDLVQALQPSMQGLYIMPPFRRYNLAAELLEAL